jgi:hypothetical protein
LQKHGLVQYTGPFRNPKKKKYISKETRSYYFLYFQVIDIISVQQATRCCKNNVDLNEVNVHPINQKLIIYFFSLWEITVYIAETM